MYSHGTLKIIFRLAVFELEKNIPKGTDKVVCLDV